MVLQTHRLNVILQTREEIEAMIEAMSEYDRAQISPEWLARLHTLKVSNPWEFGYRLVIRETDTSIGSCSFKGPPVNGVVEIAYGVDPDYEGNGYATEAARALVDFAFDNNEVSIVRAHTLPDAIASKRVLAKCGFEYVGDTVDPEDGNVSRFEMTAGDNQSAKQTH